MIEYKHFIFCVVHIIVWYRYKALTQVTCGHPSAFNNSIPGLVMARRDVVTYESKT